MHFSLGHQVPDRYNEIPVHHLFYSPFLYSGTPLYWPPLGPKISVAIIEGWPQIRSLACTYRSTPHTCICIIEHCTLLTTCTYKAMMPVVHMSRKHMVYTSTTAIDGRGYDHQQKHTVICDTCRPCH